MVVWHLISPPDGEYLPRLDGMPSPRVIKFDSFQAYHILTELFPSWETLTTDAEVCAVCDALIHISKGDKREIRRKAEEEKVRST